MAVWVIDRVFPGRVWRGLLPFPEKIPKTAKTLGVFLCGCVLLLCADTARAANGVFQRPERPAVESDPWHRKLYPLWQQVLKAERSVPGFTPKGEHFGPLDAPTWRNMVALAGQSPELKILRMVNGYFNQWRPKNDEEVWNTAEHWASPKEFAKERGGDCEDYAIAKYFALRFFGIEAERMRITVVRRKNERGQYAPQLHAVLAVRANDTWFILDNNARPKNNIFPQTQYKGQFDPLYSVNENGAWVHGSQSNEAAPKRQE